MRVAQSAGRFVSPDAYVKQLQKLHAKEGELKKAKTAAKEHRSLMTRAHYSPEGYKKAVAKMKQLDAKVKTLDAEVKQLRDLMTRT